MNNLSSTINSSSKTDDIQSRQEVAEKKLEVINYVSENHFSVITQMTGSVWPKVLPYCIANSLLTYAIFYMRNNNYIDLTFADKGHNFMSMLISFLVVTRSSIAYSRFMTAQSFIIDCAKSGSELVQHAVCFTRNDTSSKAVEWRRDLARRTIVLLNTLVSVLQYQSQGEHAWKTPDLSLNEKKALLHAVGKSNERAPLVLTLFLRSVIVEHPDYMGTKIPGSKEGYLLNFVSNFVASYHGLMQLVTTPFPFPLVQMARTFLFIWVFSLPFVLAHDYTHVYALILITFILTYGFVGLEHVSIELDDPFGDDPCDFDISGLMDLTAEDIFVYIYDVDGEKAANELKQSIYSRPKDTTKKGKKKKKSDTKEKRGSVEHLESSKPLQRAWMEKSKLISESKRGGSFNKKIVKTSSSHHGEELDTRAVFANNTKKLDLLGENEPLLKEEP